MMIKVATSLVTFIIYVAIILVVDTNQIKTIP